MSKASTVLIALTLFGSLAASAQTAQPQPAQSATTASQPEMAAKSADPATMDGGAPRYIRPETPEQRMARIGTPTDPGPDPDPTTVWWRFSKKYTIHKFDKQFAKYDQVEGWVRPWAAANFAKEIYQENDKYVWVWHEEIDTQAIAAEEGNSTEYRKYPEESIKYFESTRNEFSELTPQDANVTIRFEESSQGLPTDGSWRNSLAVADMNEDGKMDLIFPPQRGAESSPAIYLGDGNGGWTLWQVDWPISLNYGGVAVGDFNKDKHLDLAFAVHLTGVAIFLGDGKGKFTDVQLPSGFPTRRVITTDVDKDGWLDVVSISEGPVARGPEAAGSDKSRARLRAFLNRDKGKRWESLDISKPDEYLGGDWLTAANLNGDKYPDFVGASVYFNGNSIVQLSSGEKKWNAVTDYKTVPLLGFFNAVTAGRFTNAKTDDAIISYVRRWPTTVNPKLVPTPPSPVISGVDRLSWDGKAIQRTPIARWASSRGTWGMGSADLNGDGKLDVLYTRWDPREAAVLLGDGAGNFKRAKVEGVTLRNTINYDVQLADVNGDKRPDLIVMYESDEQTAFGTKNGSVQVFLNRGVQAK